MAPRQRSAPYSPAPPTGAHKWPTHQTSSAPASSAQLLTQADALARMTYELNMRSVSKQAERLESDLQALVLSTGEDVRFRKEHERRVQDLWKELIAVKAHMASLDGSQVDIRAEYESCQRHLSEWAEMLRNELGNIKGLLNSIHVQLDQLPGPDDGEREGSRPSRQGPGDTAAREKLPTPQEHGAAGPRTAASHHALGKSPSRTRESTPSQKRRVQEAIDSTRRWNRDHKTTALAEAVFTARYFKQQSKRDPCMAVLLQKGVERRLRSRMLPRRSRPRSIDEFCKDVCWQDVIETVEQVLVRDKDAVTRMLR